MAYERVNVSLPVSLLNLIDEICQINWISRSEFIRNAVREYISSIDDDKENSEE